MKLKFLFSLLLGLFLQTTGAFAYNNYPELDKFASIAAMRSVHVNCPTDEEWQTDPLHGVAWGYVDYVRYSDHMTIDPEICIGALAVLNHDTTVPRWQRAAAILVITHEAYHLRNWWGAGLENEVECKAIRHIYVAAQLLGLSVEEAKELMPYAIALHWGLVAKYRQYYKADCIVPNLRNYA